MTNQAAPAFRPMMGDFEPSAIQQLPDGRFLVVEDERSRPLSLVSIGAGGSVDAQALTAGLLQLFSAFWQFDDLEGLALDQAGFLYAVTSHSRDDDGDEKQSRQKLVRFRVDGDRVVDPRVVDGLKQALTAAHPLLAAAARLHDVKASGGLNIEGLEISPDQQRLLIGFRSPLHDGRALIAVVENPSGIFESDEAPRLAGELEVSPWPRPCGCFSKLPARRCSTGNHPPLPNSWPPCASRPSRPRCWPCRRWPMPATRPMRRCRPRPCVASSLRGCASCSARCCAPGARFERLPMEEQHRARKQLKRLRYLADFTAALWPGRDWLRCGRRLSLAQDALGLHQDVAVAAEAFRHQAASDARAWFAAGWLQAHQAVTARAAAKALVRLTGVPVFWR